MRPIEFRAWNKNNKTMWYPKALLWNWNIMLPPDEARKYWITMSKEIGAELELMQFTGLLDKNGKKIWEGDLLTQKGYDSYLECIFEDGAFIFKRITKYDYRYCANCDFHSENWEIVGNVYENPEWLEKK